MKDFPSIANQIQKKGVLQVQLIDPKINILGVLNKNNRILFYFALFAINCYLKGYIYWKKNT